jgi:hypothetical protein
MSQNARNVVAVALPDEMISELERAAEPTGYQCMRAARAAAGLIAEALRQRRDNAAILDDRAIAIFLLRRVVSDLLRIFRLVTLKKSPSEFADSRLPVPIPTFVSPSDWELEETSTLPRPREVQL